MGKYITDETKKLIGMQSQPFTWDVERGAIRRFAQAVGDPNPLFNDEQEARKSRFGGMIATPTFCRSLVGGDPRIFEMPTAPKNLLDGGSDWEYFRPIRPGDRITVVTSLVDMRETEGRMGTMLVRVIETRYTNQFNEVCATQRMTLINY